MLSLTSRRALCSSRTLVPPKRMATGRHSGRTAVTRPPHHFCNNDSSRSRRDLKRANSCFTTPWHQRQSSVPTRAPFRNYCARDITHKCWKCEQPLEEMPAFFCLSCKVVQPPTEGTSYFKIMACDGTFSLDPQKLQRRYVQLQRALHPDNFSQKSEEEQKYSEIQSALVNKAYRTLLKPLSRGLYMLELRGVRIEEGTDAGAPPDFLMELMEINEALDQARTSAEADKIGRDTKAKLAELTDEIDATLHRGDLGAAKALLAQMKYYANIEEKVKEKLSQFM